MPSLVHMFTHYRKLIKKHGFGSKAVLWNHTYSIHVELEKIAKRKSRIQAVATNGWPSPDFHAILTRIVKMRRELSVLLFQTGISGPGFMQKQFKALLSRAKFGEPPNISRFARTSLRNLPSIIMENSRPG